MTFRHNVVLGLVVSLVISALPVNAEDREQRQIKWPELSELIGKKVRIIMPDGVLIEGRAAKVQSDALTVDIKKSGDSSRYPRGRFLVSRATLRTFSVDQPRKRGRLIGVAVAGSIAVPIVVQISDPFFPTGLRAAVTGGAVAFIAGGYFLGRAADRRTLTYVITQDSEGNQ